MSDRRRNKAKAECEALGGNAYLFSQSEDAVKSKRFGPQYYNDKTQHFDDKLYVGGMCHAISMYWIAFRAGQKKGEKRSFWEWLKPEGQFNDAAINVLVTKTVMYKPRNRMRTESESAYQASFFAQWRLRPARESAENLEEIKRLLDSIKSRYYMINLQRDGGGHAVAAQSTKMSGVTFFDPNYGEYHLPTKKAFRSWFDLFLGDDISGYGRRYNVSKMATGYESHNLIDF